MFAFGAPLRSKLVLEVVWNNKKYKKNKNIVIIRAKTYAIGSKVRMKGVSTFFCYNTEADKIHFDNMEKTNKMFDAFEAEFTGPTMDNSNKLYEGHK